MDEIGLKGYLAAIATFVAGVGTTIVVLWNRLKKGNSEVNQSEKRTDAEIKREDMKVKVEQEKILQSRLDEQYDKYFKRRDDDAEQLRKMVQECREDCDRREKAQQDKMERQEQEWERKYDILTREYQNVAQMLSHLRGWVRAIRSRVQKLGIDVPAEETGSGVHEPLPPPPPGENGP